MVATATRIFDWDGRNLTEIFPDLVTLEGLLHASLFKTEVPDQSCCTQLNAFLQNLRQGAPMFAIFSKVVDRVLALLARSKSRHEASVADPRLPQNSVRAISIYLSVCEGRAWTSGCGESWSVCLLITNPQPGTSGTHVWQNLCKVNQKAPPGYTADCTAGCASNTTNRTCASLAICRGRK